MACVFASVFLLASCRLGGGGGSAPAVNPNLPIQNTAPIRAATGGAPLNMSPAQIKSQVANLAGKADEVLASDIITVGGQYYTSANCSGTVCTIGGQRITLNDLNLDELDYGPVMSRNGVAVVQTRQKTPFGAGDYIADVVGGIMDHAGFAVSAQYYQDAQGANYPVAYALALGNDTGSRPRSGTATWRGVMTGANMSSYEGLIGDATLTANFAASNIDAAFTNVHEMKTGADRSSILFNNVPFTSDGFESGSGSNRIEGKFYGPDHAEAAGVFRRGSVVGAFGANR